MSTRKERIKLWQELWVRIEQANYRAMAREQSLFFGVPCGSWRSYLYSFDRLSDALLGLNTRTPLQRCVARSKLYVRRSEMPCRHDKLFTRAEAKRLAAYWRERLLEAERRGSLL